MYGKMQKSGLTKIISLVCTSVIWGLKSCILRFLRVHHRECLQRDDCQVAGIPIHWGSLAHIEGLAHTEGHRFHASGLPLLVMNDHYLGNIT